MANRYDAALRVNAPYPSVMGMDIASGGDEAARVFVHLVGRRMKPPSRIKLPTGPKQASTACTRKIMILAMRPHKVESGRSKTA